MNNESDFSNKDTFEQQSSADFQSQRFFGLPAIRVNKTEAPSAASASLSSTMRRISAKCREMKLFAL